MPKTNPVSRLDFLKLVGTAGTAFMLLPLVPLGRVIARTVPINSKPIIIKRVKEVGRDGVALLYPTKPKGFVWYMNHDEPLDLHFERGVVLLTINYKNKDGS